ncbi:hypothetical protein UlMin_026982 [Ulmus minor]
MLSLLIPGPQSPGKDMDVFLRLLIEELKELWENGIDTRDAGNDRKVFKMRAALLWTVNDFPARSSLSGWSGQGYKACPTCNEDTPSMRVIGKTAYFGHYCFLPSTHRWRSNLDFDGRTERKHPHKSKDTDNARRDLQNLGIRSELHLYEDGNRLMKPAAEYTFSEANRRKFCRFVRSVKFPDGFASNLSKNVAQNDSRIVGLKSHDCHVIMQRLLPVGCRSLVNKTISSTIIELCTFFNQLCARTVNVTNMVKAQDQLVIILCKLERIFPPAFFDIMIHLVLHLPEEAILGGPVYMRWMYPFERNTAKPEGSISEGYVVDEALTRQVRQQFHIVQYVCQLFLPLPNFIILKLHAPEVTHELLSLASKLNIAVSSYPACIVNGVRFVTHARDVRLKTQNSGVFVPGTENEIFYGQLQEILEFSYLNDFSVVLFKCKWFRCDSRHMVTENNITSINITSESYKDDQFILASQAQQVFYVEDPSRGPNWRVVQHVNHRSIWDITEDGMSDIDLLQDNSSSNFTLFVDLGNLPQINLQRNDGDVIPIVQPFTTVSQHVNETASFLNDDDEEDVSEEDDETVEESADEETDEGNDVVDTEEDDDDHILRSGNFKRSEKYFFFDFKVSYPASSKNEVTHQVKGLSYKSCSCSDRVASPVSMQMRA